MIEDISFVIKNKTYRNLYENVSDNEIDLFLNTHPINGSMKSVKDFFTANGLKSKAYKLPKEHLKEIEAPFIAHLTNSEEFVIVTGNNPDNFIFQAKAKTHKNAYSEFLSRWSGNILLVDRVKGKYPSAYIHHTFKQNGRTFSPGLFLICILLLLFIISSSYSNDWRVMLLGFLLIPLFATTELLNIENGKQTTFSKHICNFSKLVNCEATLSSPISKLFKVSFATLGFFLFIALSFLSIFLIFSGSSFLIVFKLVALLSLLLTPFSIFLLGYQIIILRKMCPFCFIVQLFIIIIGSLFFLNIPAIDLIQVIKSWEIFVLTFLVSILIVIYITSSLNRKNSVNRINHDFLKIKRKPNVFFTLIQSSKDLNIDQNLILKSTTGEIQLTFILDLSCKICISAIKEYIHIFKNVDKLGISVVLMVRDEHVEYLQGFINKVYYTYNNKQDWFLLLEKWYSDKYFKQSNMSLDFERDYIKDVHGFTKDNEFTQSPILVFNNKIIPKDYSYYDLSDILKTLYT